MSIPLVFGWGKKSVEVGYIGINQCTICNQIVHFSINDISNNIRVYFVPIAKLNKKHYLVCTHCQNGWEIEEDDYKNLMYFSMISLPRDQTEQLWSSIGEEFKKISIIDDNNKNIVAKKIIEKYGDSEFVNRHIERYSDLLLKLNGKREE